MSIISLSVTGFLHLKENFAVFFCCKCWDEVWVLHHGKCKIVLWNKSHSQSFYVCDVWLLIEYPLLCKSNQNILNSLNFDWLIIYWQWRSELYKNQGWKNAIFGWKYVGACGAGGLLFFCRFYFGMLPAQWSH